MRHPARLSALIGLMGSCLLLGMRPAFAAPADPGAIGGPQILEPRVAVYVTGAVRRPGVYRLAPGTRVADAISAAGGTRPGATLADLPLALPLQDGDTVRIPTESERALAGSGEIVALPASFDPRAAGGRYRSAARARSARSPARAVPGRPGHVTARIDLNRAGTHELQRLPGVGPGLASRILAYRARVGRFRRVEELREVQGIGERRFARIAPHVELR